jgi:hypothetical protein
MLENQNPEQHDTHKRRKGGNCPAGPGEKHDSKKAEKIPETRRWDKDAQKIETPDE